MSDMKPMERIDYETAVQQVIEDLGLVNDSRHTRIVLCGFAEDLIAAAAEAQREACAKAITGNATPMGDDRIRDMKAQAEYAAMSDDPNGVIAVAIYHASKHMAAQATKEVRTTKLITESEAADV